MVRSQSRSFSFPHLGSASWVARNVANAELYNPSLLIPAGGVVKLLKVVITEGNEVTKGVYSERYGKCERRIGDSGGGFVEGESVGNKAVNAEKNDRCRFQISMKLEKTAVREERSSNGASVSNDAIMGARKCYERHD